MSGIESKVVVITGASSGIGAAAAKLLASRGAKLVLGARRKDRLDALAAGLADAGAEVAVAEADVRKPADVANLVQLAVDRFGRLDVLVGNAGVATVAPLDSSGVEEWDAMIDVNLKGVLHGIAAALPVFREQGHGQFVHTASTAAYKTVPGQAVYSATKVAVRTISEGLRQEAGESVRVSVISPGVTRTEFIENVPESEVKTRYAAMAIPPDAIARAIAFAIEQPPEVDVNEIVVRPAAQA
ncbi:SDR family oxidoreductase [Amycolatopsis sp. CA-230715]|uniref:SDR family oxidoreductase n=1 Tax=Amycolatopsis sp. CA-230715 TaxID=2745196 RepID=UPI001C01455F|nr:SDR family oxidoreductase [Amycolatopsis sp. CA-230715]QWF78188.1 putative oxidoreductase [Amycolatopsis sp. CA-230715]